MTMTKEAIQYLMEQGITPEDRLVNFDNEERWLAFDNDGQVKEILPRVFNAKEQVLLNTLSGMVNYIKSNLERVDEKLILQIKNEEIVSLIGTLEIDGSREKLAVASAIVPEFRFDTYHNLEEFNIALQSKFVENEDRKILLQVVGNVSEDNIKTVGDDGVSQVVTINQGVASKADVKVPNPVELSPYRTFLEVEQPTSQFVFRMKDGPSAAIFEADGGAWRNQAIVNIREYFKEQLKEEIEANRITILA
ncbi:hypothetical protein ACWOAH_09865 [Vagococcus vulneris]|uniref:Phage protein n=1 Tax=Vagococcus vulneris TaxID=1977869 RepID=A0A429ZX76_9ENTE|nr:hypothetical protein [Vagococcus vulneris]RST98279.1 hypothetical protein CBF37_08180 [Vagococcus vulneris]